MSSTKLKTANIVSLDASKLTGTMPAISGANLTGVAPFTVSASDPLITTNPAGGLGTLWMNSTSGETYILTDATAGANIWINVGSGSGSKRPYWHEIGTVAGFAMGGTSPDNVIIDRYPFASNTTATDHGDLTIAKLEFDGCSSNTDGYGVAGTALGVGPSNVIDKFSFASTANATDFGDTTVARYAPATCGSNTHGYAAGGDGPSNVIDKFAYGSNANATDVGDLTGGYYASGGHSSETHGYVSGGFPPGQSKIDKFSFSSNGNATGHGNLTAAKYYCPSLSGPEDGYIAGGFFAASPQTDQVEKFSYASNTTAASHGTLVSNMYGMATTQNGTTGFLAGGAQGSVVATIRTFSFETSNQNATHGSLSAARRKMAGTND
jgi:hypothetical protein